jgi:ribose transport system ATP-binding protein
MGQACTGELIFKASHMHKAFGPTIALKDVDFELHRGEIRGLIGENGSGKSTIMSIASGMQPATSGEMFFKGEPWKPKSMLEGQRGGIAMILQESNTIPRVTVAENLFAGREKEFSKCGIINMKKMYAQADGVLAKFGITQFKGKTKIDSLSFETRKLIEIIRAMEKDPDILVVDETTTALSFDGREILYKIIKDMAANNKAVVFISHDLDEIMDKCTHVTVLRDGDIIDTLEKSEFNAKKISTLMVGRDIGDAYYREDFEATHLDEVGLEFKNVCYQGIKDFNLTLHKGEIVGIGGLSDCGMHTIGHLAFGVRKPTSGSITRNGKPVKSPTKAIDMGIGYISKNRDTDALILNAPIKANIILPSLDRISKFLFVRPSTENEIVDNEIKNLSIKCHSPNTYVSKLSGGNKQKVSFAKWTANKSDVIIMDCPTRGVDVAVKQAMYKIINDMKKEGKAILLISEEMTELIGMSDRLLIMNNYKVVKEFERSKDLKETDIIEYML